MPAGRLARIRRPVSDWRRQIAWVPQSPYLFAGTIAREHRARRSPAAPATPSGGPRRLAGAEAFIAALPGGFDTRLGERALDPVGRPAAADRAGPRVLARRAARAARRADRAPGPGDRRRRSWSRIETLMAGRTVLLVTHGWHRRIHERAQARPRPACCRGSSSRGRAARSASRQPLARPLSPATDTGPPLATGREPLARLLRLARPLRGQLAAGRRRRRGRDRLRRRAARRPPVSCWPGRRSTRASSRSPARWSRCAPSASAAASSGTASGSARTTSPSGCWPTCGWRSTGGWSGWRRPGCARSGPATCWPGWSATWTPSRTCSSAASPRRSTAALVGAGAVAACLFILVPAAGRAGGRAAARRRRRAR